MSIRGSDDNDVTVFPAQAAIPGESALSPGTMVAEFRIERLIGEGGFGIVYLAHDETLDRVVALKEYMPAQLAQRPEGTLSVQVRSQRHAEPFAAGLRSFMNEARLLARFDHPSLLKVHRFFQANGTAYMAMPFYQGQTLKAVLRGLSGPPDEAWLTRLLHQLLDGLEIIHAHECYHRDISPDNILMLQNDTPILLDFGAARRVIGDMTQSLTVILKPGYAPIEQYAEDPDMKQGPWTDLYALASVVYFAVTRQPPPASIARAMNDRLVPLSQRAGGAYSERFLSTIDAALSLRPEDRPQNVGAFRAMLGVAEAAAPRNDVLSAAAPVLSVVDLARDPVSAPRERATQPVSTGPRSAGPVPAATRGDATIAPPVSESPPPAGRSSKGLAIAGIGIAVPAVLGLFWWLTSREAAPPAAPAERPPAPAIATAPPVQEIPRVAPAPPPAYVPSPPPQAVAPKPEPPPPAKTVERTPPPKAIEKPPPQRVETAKAAAPVEPPKPKPAPVAPAVAREAPPPAAVARVEEPAPPPAARVEPEPKPPAPAPAAKSEPPAQKPVEVARVEPKPAPAPPERSPLIGRYIGNFSPPGGLPVGMTLVISSVDNGVVTGTATHNGGPCAGEYHMRGRLSGDTLRMGSTNKAGRAGDCGFGFRLDVSGNRLTGETGNGLHIVLSR